MLRQGKVIVAIVLLGLLAGCVHKPPAVIPPHGPVIDYGPPGAVTR